MSVRMFKNLAIVGTTQAVRNSVRVESSSTPSILSEPGQDRTSLYSTFGAVTRYTTAIL